MSLQNRKRTSARSGIDGYNAIITTIAYQGTAGIPALNGLSTLVGSSEKSEVVRSKYLRDYVEDKDTFLEAAERIRSVL